MFGPAGPEPEDRESLELIIKGEKQMLLLSLKGRLIKKLSVFILAAAAGVLACHRAAAAQNKEQVPLYLAFVMHMHQPIYYPGMPMNWDYFNMPTDPGSNMTIRQVFDETGFTYRRPATLINNYPQAKLTVHFTGSLMMQLDFLAENGFVSKGTSLAGMWDDYKAAMKTGRLEAITSGFHHPIFPLIDKPDAEWQFTKLQASQRAHFQSDAKGFFPPEMAFDMSIIPWLNDFGVQWTLFDSFHIMGLPNKDHYGKAYCEAAYRPHWAEYGGARIIVIPRDHWFGQNQSDGFDPNYLVQELAKVQQWNTDPSRPFLVVIASDGDNGWMRQAGGGYYDWFWPGLIDALNNPANGWIKLATVSEYLGKYKPTDSIQIERGSWGVGGTRIDLSTWDGSPLHKEMWARVNDARKQLESAQSSAPALQMAQAWDWFTMAETSCYWYWNNKDWAQKSYTALDLALQAVKKSAPRNGEIWKNPKNRKLESLPALP